MQDLPVDRRQRRLFTKSTGEDLDRAFQSGHPGAGATSVQRCSFFVFTAASRQAANAALFDTSNADADSRSRQASRSYRLPRINRAIPESFAASSRV